MARYPTKLSIDSKLPRGLEFHKVTWPRVKPAWAREAFIEESNFKCEFV